MITTFFSTFGKIVNLDIPLVKRTGSIKGFCFVVFQLETACQAALAFKNPRINNKAIAIRPALKPKDASSQQAKLQGLKVFIRGFPVDT